LKAAAREIPPSSDHCTKQATNSCALFGKLSVSHPLRRIAAGLNVDGAEYSVCGGSAPGDFVLEIHPPASRV